MWAFLHFVCASLFCVYFRRFGERLRNFSRADGHSRKEVFLTFGVLVGRDGCDLLGRSLSAVSSHRQSSTGSVVVSATWATTPLSLSILKKNKRHARSSQQAIGWCCNLKIKVVLSLTMCARRRKRIFVRAPVVGRQANVTKSGQRLWWSRAHTAGRFVRKPSRSCRNEHGCERRGKCFCVCRRVLVRPVLKRVWSRRQKS